MEKNMNSIEMNNMKSSHIVLGFVKAPKMTRDLAKIFDGVMTKDKLEDCLWGRRDSTPLAKRVDDLNEKIKKAGLNGEDIGKILAGTASIGAGLVMGAFFVSLIASASITGTPMALLAIIWIAGSIDAAAYGGIPVAFGSWLCADGMKGIGDTINNLVEAKTMKKELESNWENVWKELLENHSEALEARLVQEKKDNPRMASVCDEVLSSIRGSQGVMTVVEFRPTGTYTERKERAEPTSVFTIESFEDIEL